ncbi:MAG: GatB/YqeY domain-containing protein [Gammaproteobacteria bacterium]|nr:GatB/YqeY domain-containing protein [Gammaproteobacteria bacterium]MBU2478274.1 GatB/YqeY domain-containing protein [Gammaproteobacteria bacterium]
MSLKARIQEDMKATMRSGDKPRLGVIRLILAAIKQREVDERIELDDTQILVVLDKMLKQRRESLGMYEKAGRADLADQESYEIGIVQTYLPQQLTAAEVDSMIAAAIAQTGASGIKDMGKVMGILKPQLQGRADMTAVSGQIKAQLGA